MQNALNVTEKATTKGYIYIYIEKSNSLQPISVELEVKRKKNQQQPTFINYPFIFYNLLH